MAAGLTPEEERTARRILREMVDFVLEEAGGRFTVDDVAGRAAESVLHHHPEVAGLVLRDAVRQRVRKRLRETGGDGT